MKKLILLLFLIPNLVMGVQPVNIEGVATPFDFLIVWGKLVL